MRACVRACMRACVRESGNGERDIYHADENSCFALVLHIQFSRTNISCCPLVLYIQLSRTNCCSVLSSTSSLVGQIAGFLLSSISSSVGQIAAVVLYIQFSRTNGCGRSDVSGLVVNSDDEKQGGVSKPHKLAPRARQAKRIKATT